MFILSELPCNVASYLQSRGSFNNKLGITLLKGFKLIYKEIIFKIGNNWLIKNIISFVMLVNFLP